MTRCTILFVSMSLALVAGAGCENEEAKPAAKPAKPAGKTAGNTVTKTFEHLKQVSLDVPEDAYMLSAVTNDFVQVGAEGLVVSVSVAGPAASKTFADDKEEHEKSEACTFTSWVKAEELPDGWVIHTRCKGAEDFEGHGVDVRRNLAGVSYDCGWDFLETAAEADATINACLSLEASAAK